MTSLIDRATATTAVLDEEDLFREAKRRERKRRLFIATLAAVLVVAATSVVRMTTRHQSLPASTGPAASAASEGSTAVASAVLPLRPSALAAAPNGDLYISDGGRQQILERSPSGRFRVVAGTGKAGFTGDGGQATRAEIDEPSSLALGRDGTLYFAQQGSYVTKSGDFRGSTNTVIRAISPHGVIRTVVGLNPNCKGVSISTTAMPAENALLYGAQLSIGSDGRLAISGHACVNQSGVGPFLTLTASGVVTNNALDKVGPASVDCLWGVQGKDFTAFTCDSGGAASGYGHPKELLVVRASGSYTGYGVIGSEVGAVASGSGEVIAVHSHAVVRVTAAGISTLASEQRLDRLFSDSWSVEAINGLTIDGRGGVFLTPDIYRRLPGCGAVIAELTSAGHLLNLWNETSRICY